MTADQEGIEVSKARILQVSPPLPNGVFCASPRLDSDLVAKLRSALLSFDIERELGRKTLSKVLPITGFAPVEMATFEDIDHEIEIMESSQ